ncbi:sodium:proton antiporter [Streptomyces hoynatensis]|uniref:Sodium:proton antiporter n=2 Tax=Streptomyces hoynatensis TaxID=1141874 RepID=A0A3A9Z271_9ACTN|nr:sodium:proton antiporter [Streptomyces hoynatensis]
MVVAAGLLVLGRLLRGPRVLDRVVALDALVTLLVAGAVVGSRLRGEAAGGHVVIVLALLGFVGTLAAARLVQRREDMR